LKTKERANDVISDGLGYCLIAFGVLILLGVGAGKRMKKIREIEEERNKERDEFINRLLEEYRVEREPKKEEER
jgi:hypothetical protein